MNTCPQCGYAHRDWLKVSTPSVMYIVNKVAGHHGVNVAEILSERRDKRTNYARKVAIWLACELRPDMTLVQVGRVFNRDHTTIMFARNSMRSMVGDVEDAKQVWIKLLAGQKQS